MGCIYFETLLNDYFSKYVETQNIFSSRPRHCDVGLIIFIVYSFQIWNKQKKNSNIIWVICSHIDLILDGYI